MPTKQITHPELELGLQYLVPESENLSDSTLVDFSQHDASFDLVEICHDKASVRRHLDFNFIQEYFEEEEENENTKPRTVTPFRILFVNDPAYGDSAALKEGERPKLNKIAVWIHQRLGVSLPFFQYMSPTLKIQRSGNGCFSRSDDGKDIALDGFYMISHGQDDGPAHVWFSHSLLYRHSSLYVIYNVFEESKERILTCAENLDTSSSLLRPLAVDTFLVEWLLWEWTNEVGRLKSRVLLYEKESTIAELTPLQSGKAVNELHLISRKLHTASENLSDFTESPQFLVQGQAINSITESLALLQSRADELNRWAKNYDERTNIRINMVFNLTTQLGSRTNLDIARLTTKIAISAQKDSSSMITMAAVTMFFLPGSFVSALFSMVFFNSQSTETGQTVLAVSPQWWLFPSVTVPLTVLVFITWVVWQRHRNSTTLKDVEVGGNNGGIGKYWDEGSSTDLEKHYPWN